MLLIPHFVAPSTIHGLGCFSQTDVIKGAKVWEFHPLIDRVITVSELEQMPSHVIALVQRHAEFIPAAQVYRLGADGDFFMNHSDDPNIEDHGDYAVARRNIAAGEELTWDYRISRVWSFPVAGVLASPELLQSAEPRAIP